jgi:hypothetical protein
VLVQLGVAVFGQYPLELLDYILKHGEQVVVATELVNAIDVTTLRAQEEDTM